MGSMDPGWLSKAYLVYDEPGGTAIFVDSGAPLGPLLAAVEQNDLAVTHLLTTHGHGDHISGDEELVSRFGVPIVKGPVETGKLLVAGARDTGPFGRRARRSSSTARRRSRATRCSRTRSAAATSRR